MTYTMDYRLKRLRYCTAWVREYTCSGKMMFDLISYKTFVARLQYANGAWRLMLLPKWRYSVTTQSHIRKFVEDYAKYRVTCGELAWSAECEFPISRYGEPPLEARFVPCEEALRSIEFSKITVIG